EQLTQMKLKLCMLTLGGLVAWSSAAMAQTNTPAPDAVATPSVAATNDAPAGATAGAGTAVAPADAAAQPAAAAAPADSAAQSPAEVAANDSSSASGTNAPAQPGAVIPLI